MKYVLIIWLAITQLWAVGEAGAIFLLIAPGAGPAGTARSAGVVVVHPATMCFDLRTAQTRVGDRIGPPHLPLLRLLTVPHPVQNRPSLVIWTKSQPLLHLRGEEG